MTIGEFKEIIATIPNDTILFLRDISGDKSEFDNDIIDISIGYCDNHRFYYKEDVQDSSTLKAAVLIG